MAHELKVAGAEVVDREFVSDKTPLRVAARPPDATLPPRANRAAMTQAPSLAVASSLIVQSRIRNNPKAEKQSTKYRLSSRYQTAFNNKSAVEAPTSSDATQQGINTLSAWLRAIDTWKKSCLAGELFRLDALTRTGSLAEQSFSPLLEPTWLT